ncbi:hypothetical protein HMPREF0204_13327 [Chryseobacterium gleum ATCC 35910]|uniref:Uncharacterized protein n=1 Tax=Chryseobacterium gleum ATCC 35910 TaxID=525257 RepID=A0ABN0AMJ9_CHRGE|nr:hypothetical protein HMPREF0204_13327 [Chryseobacterium gleum ATCC 35910]
MPFSEVKVSHNPGKQSVFSANGQNQSVKSGQFPLSISFRII